MLHSLKRAVVTSLALPSLALGWMCGPPDPAAADYVYRPAFTFRPGPIDRPLAIAVGDFDRDGRDDIVIANFAAGTIQILLAQGNGIYAGLTGPFGVGSASIGQPTTGPFALAVADLNPGDVDGDGVPNASDDCPNYYDPIDTTTGKQPDANGNGVPDACEIGKDTNGDGIVDTAIDTDGDGIPDYDPVTHVTDNCPRMPNPGQEDADHDGVGDACPVSPDIVILTTAQGIGAPFGAVRVRLDDGEGGLAGRPSYLTGAAPGGLVLADFTGDSLKDLVVTNSPNGVMQFFTGMADGQFGNQSVLVSGQGPQGLAAADIDGDGHPDLVVGDRTGNQLSVYRNGGTGLPATATATISTIPSPPTASEPFEAPTVILAGRLDSGPTDDIVVLNQGFEDVAPRPEDEGSIEVFLGGPAGTLTPGQSIRLGPGHQPRAGLLKDLDGDGRTDLVVADFKGGQVQIYAGQGDGTFATPASIIATGGQPADVAALVVDVASPSGPDLAVLDYQNNRILLYHNTGGLTFTEAPTSPASPWRQTSGMAMFGADTLAGLDLVLLQRDTARLDRLSGIGNGFFRADPTVTIKGQAGGASIDTESMVVGDFRFDNRPDLAVVDPGSGKLTLITNEITDALTEQATIDVGPGAGRLGSGALVASLSDIDHDGIPNVLDDCPTLYNPPLCGVPGPPACPATPTCSDKTSLKLTCDPANPATYDPVTCQCDDDRNGIGDQCQVLSTGATPAPLDSDFDLKFDYDPAALFIGPGGNDFDRDTVPNTVDNCPTVANTDQADADGDGVGDACSTLTDGLPVDPDLDGVPTFDPVTHKVDNCPTIYNPGQEDNDNDHVGNACIVSAALDNCPYTSNFTQADTDGDGVGDLCAVPTVGVLVPNPSGGTVALLETDASGTLRPAPASPLTGLATPTAAATGHFHLICGFPGFCIGSPTLDVAVAESGTTGDFTDDRIAVYVGDDHEGFAPLPAAPAAGDPDDLLVAVEQPVCGFVNDPATPILRMDSDGKSDILAVTDRGTSTIEIYVVSNQNVLDSSKSSLIHPVGHPAALPVPGHLRAAVMADVNNDRIEDIVALSARTGEPSAITVFIGLGNGLFFTDPSINPVAFPDEISLMTAGNAYLATKNFYPDLQLFDLPDQAPIVMTNIVLDRADIDGSGRVDGYDLAVLAAAFGSTRGEDFAIQADATLLQTGTGATRRVVGGGAPVPGQNLGTSDVICDGGFDPLTGLYGLPVDINLDGIVDGTDLAILASEFGQTLPPP